MLKKQNMFACSPSPLVPRRVGAAAALQISASCWIDIHCICLLLSTSLLMELDPLGVRSVAALKISEWIVSLRLHNQFSVSSFGSCGTEIRHFNAPRRDVVFVCILHTMLCKHFCSHQNSKSDWIPKHRCLYVRCWLPFSCDRALGMHIMFRDTHEVPMRSGTRHACVSCF